VIGGAVGEGLDLTHIVLRLGHGVRPVALRRVIQRIQLGAQDRAAKCAQRMAKLARFGIERSGLGNAGQFLALLASEQRWIVRPKSTGVIRFVPGSATVLHLSLMEPGAG
jgi:hypothetical protein